MGVRRVTLLSLTALVVVAIGAIGFGVANIAPLDVVAIIGKRLFGLPIGGEISAGSTSIVMDIRLPRILAAIAVGAALATSGAAFQSLLRNPLADPYVLGTSSGAALGAAIAFLVSPGSSAACSSPHSLAHSPRWRWSGASPASAAVKSGSPVCCLLATPWLRCSPLHSRW
jgi:ABC-type Fe3+-siderophore transport system permease subunit